MTGLPNRRAMLTELNREWSRYNRAGHLFSVVLMDLDYFKSINDRYGHDAGDRVLESFSALLKSACRESDLASRWGGEEFLILLPDTPLLDALSLAERIRHATEQESIIYEGQRIPLSLSAGVSSITQTTDLEDLLKQVDKNLYLSKEQGRNRITPRVKQNEGGTTAR
jgi:diguanylate cyclase (GGDEF)-like protein